MFSINFSTIFDSYMHKKTDKDLNNTKAEI